MTLRRWVAAALVSMSFNTIPLVYSEDLGVIGPVYKIAEQDILEYIKERLREMEKSGELAKWKEDSIRRQVEIFENPKPVPGIKQADAYRTFYVDPTYTLERDIIDENGNVIYPAGYKVNPFDYENLTKVLLFFDGRDEKQVEYARALIENSEKEIKPILVGGKPFDLMRKWKRIVFYDQGGVLSRKLHIEKVPAIVSQEGKRLRIDEIKID